MNTLKNPFSLSLFLVLLMGSTQSCRKAIEEYTETLEEDSYASAMYDDAKNIADQAMMSGSVANYKTSGTSEITDITATCATVTFDTASSPKKMTVDFGSVNCTCQDGRNRRGKIITTFTGRYRDAGTVITHTFEDYFVDDNQILGTKTVTNTTGTVFTIHVDGQIILANSAGTITWISDRVRTWTQGYNTLLWLDDVYEVTGTASGTNAAGKNFTINITNPLVRKMQLGCARNFVQGTLEIEVDGGHTRTLDYGDGTCDNIGTLTIRNRDYTINLR